MLVLRFCILSSGCAYAYFLDDQPFNGYDEPVRDLPLKFLVFRKAQFGALTRLNQDVFKNVALKLLNRYEVVSRSMKGQLVKDCSTLIIHSYVFS